MSSIDPPFRADHVGSLLRPRGLLDARQRYQQNSISKEQLRQVEDQHIRAVVQKQEAIGLRSITDGEFRRTFFHVDFLQRLQGVTVSGGIEAKFRSEHGEVNFAPPRLSVAGRLRHVEDIQKADFEFLRSVTSQTPKVTIPSPTMVHFRGGRKAIDIDAYLCDPKLRAGVKERGDDPNRLSRAYAALINSVIDGRPDELTVAVHLCREISAAPGSLRAVTSRSPKCSSTS